ncbi:MAG: FCD domain-containing protein [Arthrobacter sp.]
MAGRLTAALGLDRGIARLTAAVRAALEEIAGHSAAPHLEGKTTDLAGALDGMRAAQENGNLIALCFHSTRFHRRIVESAGNDALTRAWNALGIEMLTLVGAAHDRADLPSSVEEHTAIMAALEAGEAAAAARLLKNHACSYVTRDPGSTGAPPVHPPVTYRRPLTA